MTLIFFGSESSLPMRAIGTSRLDRRALLLQNKGEQGRADVIANLHDTPRGYILDLEDFINVRTVNLEIDGMHCDACIRRVKTALGRVPGVEVQDVALGSARVTIIPQRCAPETSSRQSRTSGMKLEQASNASAKVTFPVTGMTCAACQSFLRSHSQSSPGVEAASVNLMMNSATVEFHPKSSHRKT